MADMRTPAGPAPRAENLRIEAASPLFRSPCPDWLAGGNPPIVRCSAACFPGIPDHFEPTRSGGVDSGRVKENVLLQYFSAHFKLKLTFTFADFCAHALGQQSASRAIMHDGN